MDWEINTIFTFVITIFMGWFAWESSKMVSEREIIRFMTKMMLNILIRIILKNKKIISN